MQTSGRFNAEFFKNLCPEANKHLKENYDIIPEPIKYTGLYHDPTCTNIDPKKIEDMYRELGEFDWNTRDFDHRYADKEEGWLNKGTISVYKEEAEKRAAAKELEEQKKVISELTTGGDVTLVKNLHITAENNNGAGELTLTQSANLDLNNNTLSAVGGTYGDTLVISNGPDITISNGVINPADTATLNNQSATILIKTASANKLTLDETTVTGIYPIYVNSSNENTLVTINSGIYYSAYELNPAVYVGKGGSSSTTGGKVIINGGTFGQRGVNATYLLNVEDILRKQEGKEPRDFIEVRGGTFINFDPANNVAEGVGTNFVADGYESVIIEQGTDTIYTVKPKETI